MSDDEQEFQCDMCGNYYELSEHAEDTDAFVAASYCTECVTKIEKED
jgi:hypothetical protein